MLHQQKNVLIILSLSLFSSSEKNITRHPDIELTGFLLEPTFKYKLRTNQTWWRLVWCRSSHSQEEEPRPPTPSRVWRECRMESIRCLRYKRPSDWACNKLRVKKQTMNVTVYITCESVGSDFIRKSKELLLSGVISQRLTYTWYQDPGVRRTGGGSNGSSHRFCSVNATWEQILFIAFIPPETTNKNDIRWRLSYMYKKSPDAALLRAYFICFKSI